MGVMTRTGEGAGCRILGIGADNMTGDAGGSKTSESFGVGVGGAIAGEPYTASQLCHALSSTYELTCNLCFGSTFANPHSRVGLPLFSLDILVQSCQTSSLF
jgi:hypothetical protein